MVTSAELFHQVADLTCHPRLGPRLVAFARRELEVAAPAGEPLADQLEGCRRARRDERDRWASRALPEARCRELLVAYAPPGLLDGALLGGCSAAATHHTELAARLLDLYEHECGAGAPERHHGNLYRALAGSAGVELPEAADLHLARLAIPDAAFRLALVQLAMARFARAFLPELLGFALFHYAAGVPSLLLATREPLERAGADTRFLALHGGDPARAAEVLALAGREDRARVARGLAAAARLDAAWTAAASRTATPHERMAELVRVKAPIGHGYHAARGDAAGAAWVDELLAPRGFDAGRVLRALAGSPFVVPGDPARSRLLAESCAFGGRMFGVFSAEELATIGAWIASLGAPADERTAAGPAPALEPAVPEDDPLDRPDDAARPSTRELYFRLVNADRFPGIGPAARRYADRAFRRVRRSAWLARYQRFFAYRPEALDAWCDARHRWQVAQYRPLTGTPILSREQALWLLHQISPMTLVDGCWLQRVPGSSRPGALLRRIYRDEVGDGVVAHNHANVHRALLAGAGIELPAADARELADAPDLVDAAFELPALWLAVAFATERYFPELLGLNLAMELAGLGGPYMKFADLLRYHGIPPTIVELHNTIDNLASGHTAWARDAIHAHLDDARRAGGDRAVQLVWRRIWTGYRAHDTYFGRFSRACAYHLLPGVVARRFVRRPDRPRPASPP